MKPAKTRVTAHQVSARKAIGNHAVSAVAAATTAGVNAVIVVSGQMARTHRPMR